MPLEFFTSDNLPNHSLAVFGRSGSQVPDRTSSDYAFGDAETKGSMMAVINP
jgi:hypothetical protein